MAGSTTNYGLTKPAVGEAYDVDIFNGNADIIDTEIKKINTAPSVQALTLATGWANRGGGLAPASVYKVGNQVFARGTITNTIASSPIANTFYTLATIPTGNGFEIPLNKAVEFRLKYRSTLIAMYEGIIQIIDHPNTPGTSIIRYAVSNSQNIPANEGILSFDDLMWLNI